MSMEQQSSSSASVSGASHSDVERHNSSPPTSPASSHHSPFPPKQSNPTSPPKEQSVPQLALQAPPAFETVPVDNQVNAYTTATADDAIDPALKDLSNSFPAEPKDLQGQDPALDDFSWLPDFVPNNQSPAAVGSTNRLWPINTEFGSLPSTQPQSSASESPASPFPRRGSADWTGSHNGESATNLPGLAAGSEEKQGKDVGISKNILTSAASSESGFETGRDDGVPLPKKKSHARKQPEGHIKRARNAFILFRKHITDSNLIPPSVEVKHQNISVVAAKMWKEAPQEVRQEFQEKARLEKEEHQRKYPGYRYQPVFRRTDIIRRRVRKDPAEDEKVDAVAEALIKGKAGNDLEKEIKDQLVIKSDTSENESEVSTKSRSRRRREVGQLSKGAVRAQRAQARAKQMRQNLLGSNLLNMSLYNAANARLASSNGANEYHAQQAAAAAAGMAPHGVMNGHPGHTHPGLQCAMDSYMQMGYGMDHRPLQVGGAYPGESYGGIAQGGPASTGVESEMYRLPPIDGMMGPGNGYDWQAPPAEVDYWEQGGAAFEMVPPPQQGYPVGEGYYAARYGMEGVPAEHNLEYRLPPLMEASREDGRSFAERAPADLIANAYAHGDNDDRDLPSMRQWTHEGQQTPSNHVMFNERLFDGALGTAGIPERTEGEDALECSIRLWSMPARWRRGDGRAARDRTRIDDSKKMWHIEFHNIMHWTGLHSHQL